jgi:Kef-type K+ transport system membrane component KefB
LGVFFLLFGVFILISAYNLDNPFWFIMTFFASNLIILISGALLLGFILRMISSRKPEEED